MRFLPKRGPKVWQWFMVQTALIIVAWIFGAHSSSGDERGLFIMGAGIFVFAIYFLETNKGIGSSAFVIFMFCALFDNLLHNYALFAVVSTLLILSNMKDTVSKLRGWWFDPVWGRSKESEELEKMVEEQLAKIKADMSKETRHCDTEDPFSPNWNGD